MNEQTITTWTAVKRTLQVTLSGRTGAPLASAWRKADLAL